MRLAHLSDLHFSQLTWSPAQFLSKRWIGNLNLLLTRCREFSQDHFDSLIPIFKARDIQVVLITGDLSSTSLPSEFALAKQFIDQLKNEGFQVFTLPGNHDQYTKQAYKTQLFYDFFDAVYPASSLSLKGDNLTTTRLNDNWWLFALDTAITTSWLQSSGYFSENLEKLLEEALATIPSTDSVLLMNHFPLFCNDSKRKELKRKQALRQLLERFPCVKLYLHGHNHRHCVADLRNSHLPIILDSGSIAERNRRTWNLIELHPSGCQIELYRQLQNSDWSSTQTHTFAWGGANASLV